MTSTNTVNHRTIAPLRNVRALLQLADGLEKRAWGQPGVGVMFGHPGYGKTFAANFVRNKRSAWIVEAKEHWSRKDFATNLLSALYVHAPRGTIGQMIEQALRIMGDDPDRALIIDEADKLVDKGWIDIVRGIHEGAQSPVILIGEELLPQKLERSPRMFDRVLGWAMAEPCDAEDAALLTGIFAPGITVAPELLARIVDQTGGNARRIATTAHAIAEWAKVRGRDAAGADYDGLIHTGVAPRRDAGRARSRRAA